MFNLLKNYVKEQRKNFIQIIGLGILVIIMSAAYLGINFSGQQLLQDYRSISNNSFDQDLNMYPFRDISFAWTAQNDDFWLDQLNYYDNGTVNPDKLEKSSFQIDKISDNLYRFYFYKEDDSVFVGKKTYLATQHSYFDFNINIPAGEANSYDGNPDHTFNNLVDSYVYQDQSTQSTNDTNRTNYFIRDWQAFNFYNDHKDEFINHRDYGGDVFSNEAKIYILAIMGTLYDQNHLEALTSLVVQDVLITGKRYTFDAYHDFYNHPMIVEGALQDAKTLLVGNGTSDLVKNILVYKQWAEVNRLKIGDDYNIAGKTFHIVGFATSIVAAYMSYNTDTSEAFDIKNNTQVWMNPEGLEVVKSAMKNFIQNYIYRYNFYNPEIGSLKNGNFWLYQYFHNLTDKNPFLNNQISTCLFISFLNMGSSKKPVRILSETTVSFITNRVYITDDIARLFLGLIFMIAVFIVFLLIFKLVNRNRRIIGVLKASGYSNWKISIALMVSIIWPLFIFSIIGISGAVLIAHFLTLSYQSTISLLSYGWFINWWYAAIVVFLPIIVLGVIIFIITQALIRAPALSLIENRISNRHSHSSNKITQKITHRFLGENLSYRNKLIISSTLRSLGKNFLITFVSAISATMLLFALSSQGMINNLLTNQIKGVTAHYLNIYRYDWELQSRFYNAQHQPAYDFQPTDGIKAFPSAYEELNADLHQLVLPDKSQPIYLNLRDRYIMGSELNKIRIFVESHEDTLPSDFMNWWKDNQVLISYLTNSQGQQHKDIMVSFGMVPYDPKVEVPFTRQLVNAQSLMYGSDCHYDSGSGRLTDACFGYPNRLLTVLGVHNANNFYNPGFANTNLDNFGNLTMSLMQRSSYWQNQNFLNIRDDIIKKLDIPLEKVNDILFMPVASSTLEISPNYIGKVYIFNYHNLNNRDKTVIGITYDTYNGTNLNNLIAPFGWLNQIMNGESLEAPTYNEAFDNAKFSNFSGNEFKNYFSLMSSKNDYNLNLRLFGSPDYRESKGFETAVDKLMDINGYRTNLGRIQSTIQLLIMVMSVFLISLSLLIILVFTDMVVKDNINLITVLKSLGYCPLEISYNFLVVFLPLMILSSVVALFTSPLLQAILIKLLKTFFSLSPVAIIPWWYYFFTFAMSIVVYLVAYFFTWKANVKSQQLMIISQ